MKSRVAVIKTKPDSVLEDYGKLLDMAGVREALDPRATTILKDNISWHFPYLSANTTPWQLEGTIRSLRGAGFSELVAVHNNTVVTDSEKGEKLNRLIPVYRKFNVEEKNNFLPEEIKWVRYAPKTRLLALDKIFPDGIYVPDYFIGKNIVHLPTMKTHIYTTTTGAMKNAFGGLLNSRRHYAHSWILHF